MKTTPVDLATLAKLILSPQCKSIAFLTGAGVSVSSGIPDFRSPGGMYDTLRPNLLTASEQERRLMQMDPTYVVSWDIFRQNAFPYLEVRRPFILGTREHQWKATIAHRFAELLHTKTGKLTRVYTQNIDGMYAQCQEIPLEKIVHVHGTLSQVGCEGCQTDMDFEDFCDKLKDNIKDIYNTSDGGVAKTSKPILCPNCDKALVKPKTVLFGRQLPVEFFEKRELDMPNLDLLIIAGTSLVVSPANSLVYSVPESTIRVVVNQQPVGQDLGIEYGKNKSKRDFFAQGDCDEIFLQLIQELGWVNDIQAKKDSLPEQSLKLLGSL